MNFLAEYPVVLVTGANGAVGSAVAERLISMGCQVIGVTRQNSKRGATAPSSNLPHMRQITIGEILDPSNGSRFDQGLRNNAGIHLLNCGWGGSDRLTDGGLQVQLKNVENMSKLIRAAANFGVGKIVHIGTFEEDLLAEYIAENPSITLPFQSGQVDYAIAKTVARDIGILESYLCKIDFVQVRFSVVVDHRNRYRNYVSNCVEKIRRSLAYDLPSNKGIVDIIHHDDLVEGVVCALFKGRRNSNYYLGVAHPVTLGEFFADLKLGSCRADKLRLSSEAAKMIALRAKFTNETGFKYRYRYEDIISRLAINDA